MLSLFLDFEIISTSPFLPFMLMRVDIIKEKCILSLSFSVSSSGKTSWFLLWDLGFDPADVCGDVSLFLPILS